MSENWIIPTFRMYKGYGIDYNVYGYKEYSVQYCGDDYLFDTVEEAKEFIDEIGEAE